MLEPHPHRIRGYSGLLAASFSDVPSFYLALPYLSCFHSDHLCGTEFAACGTTAELAAEERPDLHSDAVRDMIFGIFKSSLLADSEDLNIRNVRNKLEAGR